VTMMSRLVAQLPDVYLDRARRFAAERVNPVTRKRRAKARAGDSVEYRRHRAILTRAPRHGHDKSARTFFTEETLETDERLP